ncbi:MAG: hypothetical protein RIC55_09165 [Pirellulaceae bacterium]
MHRVNVVVFRQNFGDLFDAVSIGVEQMDFKRTTCIVVRQQVVDQPLVVVGRSINEHEFESRVGLADLLIGVRKNEPVRRQVRLRRRHGLRVGFAAELQAEIDGVPTLGVRRLRVGLLLVEGGDLGRVVERHPGEHFSAGYGIEQQSLLVTSDVNRSTRGRLQATRGQQSATLGAGPLQAP